MEDRIVFRESFPKHECPIFLQFIDVVGVGPLSCRADCEVCYMGLNAATAPTYSTANFCKELNRLDIISLIAAYYVAGICDKVADEILRGEEGKVIFALL